MKESVIHRKIDKLGIPRRQVRTLECLNEKFIRRSHVTNITLPQAKAVVAAWDKLSQQDKAQLPTEERQRTEALVADFRKYINAN